MSTEPPTLIYIFGAGHSGSTLFDVLLSSHHDVVGTGEAHRLTLDPHNRVCACGSTLTACNWWKEVITEYRKQCGITPSLEPEWWQHAPISLPRNFAGSNISHAMLDFAAVLGSPTALSLATKFSRFARAYHHTIVNSWSIFCALAKSKSAKVVVDSTKSPLRGKLLYLRRPSKVIAIHLVRDGRAVCASSMKREGVPMKEAARRWKRDNRNAEAVLRSVDSRRVIRTRYEDICRFPRETVNQALQLAGVDLWETGVVLNRDRQHQIPGNPMLLTGVSTIALDDRWRRTLTSNDIMDFKKIAGRMNSRYGYDH